LCSNDLVNHKSDFSEWLILDDDENKLWFCEDVAPWRKWSDGWNSIYTTALLWLKQRPGSFAVVWFGSSPTPRQQARSATKLNIETERQLAEWRGERGRRRSQIVRQRESLFLSNSINTLCAEELDSI
jgi:hypothetical protein